VSDDNKVKSGLKSTEFYLSAAAVIGGLLVANNVFADGSMAAKITALIVAGLAAIGYTAQRTKIKKDE